MIPRRQILQKTKMLKYFTKGLIAWQYPKQNLLPDVLEFHEKTFLENSAALNCFVSWKSTKLTKTHAKEYLKFVSLNKDVQFWFFNDESQDAWMKSNFYEHPIYMIYQGLKFSASKSDIFRLCILSKYGGVYTGINRVFDIKLTEIFSDQKKFLISFEPNIFIRQKASSLIPTEYQSLNVVQHSFFSPPGHKVIQLAIESIIESAPSYDKVVFESVKEAIWQFSAPYFMTKVIDKYLNAFGANEIEFHGIQFNNSCRIPRGAEFRYASSPSYLGYRNMTILDTGSAGKVGS